MEFGGKEVGKKNPAKQLIAILFGKWQIFVYDQKNMRINIVGEKYDKSTFSLSLQGSRGSLGSSNGNLRTENG